MSENQNYSQVPSPVTVPQTSTLAIVSLVSGDGLATAGLVLGYLQIVFVVVPVCVIVILALLGPAIGNIFSNIIMDI